ncbi:MAG: hypothetical protein GOV02_00740 [Candidatus Aenigmarchaeota archaeon]|nr:hypothetical protein [Candidatus Aenigmarchaeota archaeon]
MFTDPFTAYGALSIPFLISNFGTFLAFLLAAIFALKYTLTFYEGRPKPLSWTLIITGLITLCISEFIQFIMPYMISMGRLEVFVNLLAQNFGLLLIVGGTYLIWKEVI